jgi:tetratricopeptide (TPR) repeat protein
LSVVLFQFWNLHGHIKEGLGWLERTLAAATTPSPQMRARAQNRIASLARLSGDIDKARSLYEKVLIWTTAEDDPWNRSFAFNGMGHLELTEERTAAARFYFETSLRIREANPTFYGGTAVTLTNLGDLAQYYDKDLAEARRLFERSLSIRVEHDDLPGIPISRLKLAALEVAEERFDMATGLLSQAVAAFTELGDRKWLASCLDLAAEIALMRLGPAAAARACGAADSLRESLGVVRAPFEAKAFERVVGEARAALRGDFNAAVASGRRAPIAAVFDQVLHSGNEQL